MKTFYLWLLLLLAPSLIYAAPKPDLWPRWQVNDPHSTLQINHSEWGQFLSKYVVTNDPSGINRVRYEAVTSADRQALSDYLNHLQQIKVSRLNRTEQKAFWINLYNALTVKVVLDHYPVKSIRDIDISPGWFSNGPWDAKLLAIEGEQLSLNDIEHRILRPIWQDNRVHYAVNCASLGCPNLQPVPFMTNNMEQLLEKGAHEYINHPRGVHFDQDGKATISSIYDWFLIDFGGTEDSLKKHLRTYANADLAAQLDRFKGSFHYQYNWDLNE